jgi:FHA domain/Class III cytochrome C family
MAFLIRRVLGAKGDADARGLSGTAQMSQVAGDMLLLGRGGAANLRFAETSVALEHARVDRLAGGGLEIVDLGSVTGTYVNGKRVERAPIREGDWVEIGRHRLSFGFSEADAPVVVEVQELLVDRAPAATPTKAAPPRAVALDYVQGYSLERRFLSRGLVTALVFAATGVAVWVLVNERVTEAFRPGPVSAAHSPIGSRCVACHAPWQGVEEERCVACHAGPEHQPTQVDAPACATCHLEHRRQPVLQRVEDDQCLACHRELRVQDGSDLRFAGRVTDFGSDHPPFALFFTAAVAGEAVRRVPLSAAIADRLDPTALRFGHALHLKNGLRGAQGRVQLDCFSCHTPGQRSGEIEPIRFERHCASCHGPLTFDPRLPSAPHDSPAVVHAFLLRSYAEIQPSAQPLEEQRRLLPRRAAEGALPQLRLDERVLREVVDAEYNLYRGKCRLCHDVDLTRVPPAVTPPAMPARWLEYASFTHQPHRMVACTNCHAQAAASTDTAEILLPDIASCRECHDERGETPAADAAGGATTRCISCHLYHDKSRTGEWGRTTPRGVWETAAGQ